MILSNDAVEKLLKRYRISFQLTDAMAKATALFSQSKPFGITLLREAFERAIAENARVAVSYRLLRSLIFYAGLIDPELPETIEIGSVLSQADVFSNEPELEQ